MTKQPRQIVFVEDGDVWFFAYGSLMWDQPFPHHDVKTATLRGYHRSFCVRSESFRGTPARPGLVLGLDRGETCTGRAIRIGADDRDHVARYLETRELDEGVYFCRPVPVTIPDGRIKAYAFVVDRAHPNYVGKLSIVDRARRIAVSAGVRGANRDYLENTLAHLDDLGIIDGSLHTLMRRVEALPRGDSL